jgi:hypothetical protein
MVKGLENRREGGRERAEEKKRKEDDNLIAVISCSSRDIKRGHTATEMFEIRLSVYGIPHFPPANIAVLLTLSSAASRASVDMCDVMLPNIE